MVKDWGIPLQPGTKATPQGESLARQAEDPLLTANVGDGWTGFRVSKQKVPRSDGRPGRGLQKIDATEVEDAEASRVSIRRLRRLRDSEVSVDLSPRWPFPSRSL